MSTDESLYLYGRTSDVVRLTEILTSSHRKPIILRGPSGIGKSAVARAVDSRISTDEQEIVLLHAVQSAAHPIDYLVDDLAHQLLTSNLLPSISAREFARSIAQIAKDNTWSLAAAALLDVVDKMLPGSQKAAQALGKQVAQELAEIAPPSMIKALREKAPQDLLVGLVNILAAINAAGIAGTIIIDQAEAASEAVREKLLGLAVEMPEKWNILLVVNDELPEGIAFLDTVWPRLAYEGGNQIVLNPLDAEDLEQWCLDKRGIAPSRLELESVVSNCEGRPLLLREWVAGASTDADITVAVFRFVSALPLCVMRC
jgi:hypothetical protein